MDIRAQKKKAMVPSYAIFSDDEVQNSFELNGSRDRVLPKDLLTELNNLQSIDSSIRIEDQSMEPSRSFHPENLQQYPKILNDNSVKKPKRPLNQYPRQKEFPKEQNYDLIAN